MGGEDGATMGEVPVSGKISVNKPATVTSGSQVASLGGGGGACNMLFNSSSVVSSSSEISCTTTTGIGRMHREPRSMKAGAWVVTRV